MIYEDVEIVQTKTKNTKEKYFNSAKFSDKNVILLLFMKLLFGFFGIIIFLLFAIIFGIIFILKKFLEDLHFAILILLKKQVKIPFWLSSLFFIIFYYVCIPFLIIVEIYKIFRK